MNSMLAPARTSWPCVRAVIQMNIMDYSPKDTREKQRIKITSNIIQVNVVPLSTFKLCDPLFGSS